MIPKVDTFDRVGGPPQPVEGFRIVQLGQVRVESLDRVADGLGWWGWALAHLFKSTTPVTSRDRVG